jgi:hypothetical protein
MVVRENGKQWTPVFRSGELMFDDIDLFSMLQLVARVVADSLGNFLKELPGSATPTRPMTLESCLMVKISDAPGGCRVHPLHRAERWVGRPGRYCPNE